MSLLGAMNTAISGLNAQSAAFGNISDNVANSQTVGFKGIDTSFQDYLTVSNASVNQSGSVVATPQYLNNVQGTVATSSDALGLAITGQGFFPVSQPIATVGSTTTFSPTPYYSRTGDFQMDKNGYIVNSSGQYLNGWAVTGTPPVVSRNAVAPIQVSQGVYNPIATSTVTLAANLPATPTAGTATATSPISSQVNVYDSLGTPHTVTLDWTQSMTVAAPITAIPNQWTATVSVPDDKSAGALAGTVRGTATVTFGTNSASAGTIGTIAALTGVGMPAATIPPTPALPGALNSPASISFSSDFGQGPQTVTLDIGTFGGSTGLTQYAGTDYSLRGLSQNGVPPGAFSSISTTAAGDIAVNYDNGQSRTIARVPIVTFESPNTLQRQNGQSFTATLASGNAQTQDAGTNGAGGLVVQSVEQSNVDIAQQFSKLIVAQQAYSANTKLITSADQMLQQTINMKQ